ncbi:phytoene desaturase family protein [Pseudobacteroides cellulosolvens]|uniref:FAD dependent oxidoreductase n=1 Tax=Pseudobacteroides cellulosolvens ATCC 35603 = DSM 2933 TaxID=398512 RepID=A0A0L6JUL6_9FIRM|nr:NAD(P)/FAD-dependent oxidoreductase [Pseudobacteroides cellulosolvens]KNY29414.1 FAD dependent oxidoreductase [Pseudobacteroides cellulosolvens ATCC 35603 = DSM 2933]
MKKIIIIGAGIAGMTAGIYGQINGFETEIYEMHSIPGGECTGWDRGEYHFDGCIHWLMGTKPETNLNKMWREVGALDDFIEIVNYDCYCSFEESGETLNLYKNADRLEKYLLEISPGDSKAISETCKAIRVLRKLDISPNKPGDMNSILDNIKKIMKILPLVPILKKYTSITVKEFAEQFKHPLIRHTFKDMLPPYIQAISMLVMLSTMNSGDSGWPMGGSKRMALRMEKKYHSLGGKIYYKSKVDKIKVDNGKATGVILDDGSGRSADYVISAADGYATLQNMLDGKYMDERLKKLYSVCEEYPIHTSIQVSIGANCDLSKYPEFLFFRPSNKVNTGGGIGNEILRVKHFCFDRSIAPKGKSVITLLMNADFDWWQQTYRSKETYNFEKKRIAKEVCTAIEERYPETQGKIEQVDVATPLTYVRYCNAWRGSWMSWMITPKHSIKYMPGNLKGLDNFFMTGQWTMAPGGLPTALMTGRWTIQRICSQLQYKFKTSK